VDCTATDDIDLTGGATLRQVAEKLRGRNARLLLANVSDQVRAQLDRSGVPGIVGNNASLTDLTEAHTECDNAEH
jgi:anti-anti-sigma regulatory factor